MFIASATAMDNVVKVADIIIFICSRIAVTDAWKKGPLEKISTL